MNQITIDLEEFLKKGTFGGIEIGMSKATILNIFPNPDDWAFTDKLMNSNIWRYGNFELHFQYDKLSMIFIDNIGNLDGGENISLNTYILDKKEYLRLNDLKKQLRTSAIPFSQNMNQIGQIILTCDFSGVEIGFTNDDGNFDSTDYNMYGFWLKKID